MLNPRIDLGNRAKGYFLLIILFFILGIIGKFIFDKFGMTGAEIFLLILLSAIAIAFLYWVIRIIIIVINSFKEIRDSK